ncbi:MAG TPA: hypothetical protein VK790_08915 [Solirubrobacteraceae bacterium]|jgi:hypothetical protein|nr:hypothetical protein [Solirubrobacteraceae bacterium]
MTPLVLVEQPAPHVVQLALNRPDQIMAGTVIPLDGGITGCA